MKVKEIKESIEKIAESEIRASAITHKAGLNLSSSEDSSGSDDFIDEEETKETVVLCSEIEKDMVDTLKLSCFNWFEFVSQMKSKNEKCTKLMLDSFYSCCQSMNSQKENWSSLNSLTLLSNPMSICIHATEIKWRGF